MMQSPARCDVVSLRNRWTDFRPAASEFKNQNNRGCPDQQKRYFHCGKYTVVV